jgi:hypothetical protein
MYEVSNYEATNIHVKASGPRIVQCVRWADAAIGS